MTYMYYKRWLVKEKLTSGIFKLSGERTGEHQWYQKIKHINSRKNIECFDNRRKAYIYAEPAAVNIRIRLKKSALFPNSSTI